MNKFQWITAALAAGAIACLGAAAFLYMSLPANAQEPNTDAKSDAVVCTSLESQVALVRQFETVVLFGKDVRAFLDLTPVAHIQADEMLIVFFADIVRIGVFKDGCMVGYMDPPERAVREILKRVRGQAV
jgi:hypothetical protein